MGHCCWFWIDWTDMEAARLYPWLGLWSKGAFVYYSIMFGLRELYLFEYENKI